jgi:hypothetical protein
MDFKIGDSVLVRANSEEMQGELFQAIDGAHAKISEIYHTRYEPTVLRFEVTLVEPVEVDREMVKVIPGLYIDNIERFDEANDREKVNEDEEGMEDEADTDPDDSADEAGAVSENRPMRTFKAFNESLEEPTWYYGMADCHGIESFIKEPLLKGWEDMDSLFDIGLMPTSAKDDPEKKKYNSQIGMMKMRAHANQQRWPVIYRAKLKQNDVDLINDLIDAGDDENALRVVQSNAETIQVAKGLGSNAERRWKMIPNPELDPMTGGSADPDNV